MPLYCYRCQTCGEQREDFAHVGSTQQGYRKDVLSDTLGISPSQIPEHKRLFPDVDVLPDGRIRFENHHQRKKYLKATGFVDRDGYD